MFKKITMSLKRKVNRLLRYVDKKTTIAGSRWVAPVNDQLFAERFLGFRAMELKLDLMVLQAQMVVTERVRQFETEIHIRRYKLTVPLDQSDILTVPTTTTIPREARYTDRPIKSAKFTSGHFEITLHGAEDSEDKVLVRADVTAWQDVLMTKVGPGIWTADLAVDCERIEFAVHRIQGGNAVWLNQFEQNYVV